MAAILILYEILVRLSLVVLLKGVGLDLEKIETYSLRNLYYGSGFCAIFTIGTFLENFRNFANCRRGCSDGS